MSLAPSISRALISDPCGACLPITSVRYSLTSADEPAAAGVAIDVPLYSMYQVFDQVPPAEVAS